MHRTIRVDATTGQRVTPSCEAGREVVERHGVVWPAEVRRWLHDRPALLPPLTAGCAPARDGGPPRVVSPTPGTSAVLIEGMEASAQEVRLEADATARELSWFVDGTFIARAPADQAVWWTPSRGQHRVVVQDEAGRSDAVQLLVR